MPTISITIEGEAASGKTVALRAIVSALRQEGFSVALREGDEPEYVSTPRKEFHATLKTRLTYEEVTND